MSEYLELAKKLKALADGGFAGEKESAQAALDRVMQKYNITPEMLEESTPDWHIFIVHHDQLRLFGQTLYAVTGGHPKIRVFRNRRETYAVELTKVQAVEGRLMFEFYWKAWQEELEVFYSAFVQANKILPDNAPVDKGEDLTADNMKKTLKMFQMAQGIDSRHYRKQLSGEGPKKIE